MKAYATIPQLNHNLKQNWSRSNYANEYRDQFGCYISGCPGNYTLHHRENIIRGLHCINAAKEISRILINDKLV